MFSPFIGGRWNPESVPLLAEELTRQRKARRDYIYPASSIGFTDDGRVVLKACKAFTVGDHTFADWDLAEAQAERTGERLEMAGDVAPMLLNNTAFGQLRLAMGIPAVFIDRLKSDKFDDIVGMNFRELLSRSDRRFLVRTMTTPDGKPYVRAILSDRYRVFDNCDLFYTAAETFMEPVHEAEPGTRRADLWKARLSDDSFELFAVSPHITGKVRLDRPFAPGEKWHDRWEGQRHRFLDVRGGDGDAHSAAVYISNSETGRGGLNVDLSCFRSICTNFATIGTSVAKIHLGKTQAEEGLLIADDTREAEGRALWLKVRDAIRTAFDPGKFQAYIDRLNNLTQVVIPTPEKAVDNVVKHFTLSEERKTSILAELMASGDVTAFGLIQAVTHDAHAVEKESPDAAARLEAIGGEISGMDSGKVLELVGAA